MTQVSNEDPLKTHRIKLRSAIKPLKLTCGHSLDIRMIPNTNCPDCWKVFFLSHKEMTQTNIKLLQESHDAEVSAVHGSKYVKQLKRFAVFVYELSVKEGLIAN